jgi:glycosyltransferase involved in cell wall biosynthesis
MRMPGATALVPCRQRDAMTAIDPAFTIAVIVTTYNRPGALTLCLRALAAQGRLPDEIVVADDGSSSDTLDAVRAAQRPSGLAISHVWHRDDGFRAAAIRNRAIAQTTSDYVVFIDGDCVPRHDFVERHAALAEHGWFVAGNRILLAPAYTDRLIALGDPTPLASTMEVLRARVTGGINRVLPWLRLPSDSAWRKRRPDRWEGAKTCNLAIWRGDLLEVDGFDEAFSGWGMEDSDLVIRLLHAGVKHKDGRFATGVFHLWHRENDRSRLAENVARLEALRASQRVRAGQGLSAEVQAADTPTVWSPDHDVVAAARLASV